MSQRVKYCLFDWGQMTTIETSKITHEEARRRNEKLDNPDQRWMTEKERPKSRDYMYGPNDWRLI